MMVMMKVVVTGPSLVPNLQLAAVATVTAARLVIKQ